MLIIDYFYFFFLILDLGTTRQQPVEEFAAATATTPWRL